MTRILIGMTCLLLTMGWGQQFPKYLYGVASWYGEEFAGKKTANGEIYDPNLYTGAHRTLPFGTIIEVENLENGKKVQLTINDRGPFVDNRILDVSKKAAEDLGFVQKGTAYVKVTVIRLGNETLVNSLPPVSNTNTSYPQGNQPTILTNYITNHVVVTNYTTTPAPQALVVPYEEKPVSQPKPNPAFILDEPEEIFVPALGQKTNANQNTPPQNSRISNTLSNEPQIIFSDILLPEERVIPLETKPLTNRSSLSPQKVQVREELQVSPYDSLQPGEKYVIQVGSFTRQENALRLYQQLRARGLPVFTSETIINHTRYVRVRVGYYVSKEEAQKILNTLYALNLNPVLLKVKP
ncbi:MAG: septal ring lytic transglycosylase RlpA family protein [Brevinematales bacterium]|nr:septal ring lytic transglycosylase RlpA family protein [Brevinematales bacterium]